MVRPKAVERPRAWNMHYNKPASAQAGKTRWTVHFMNVCHIVDRVVIGKNIGMETRERKTQPRGVLAGQCLPSRFRVQNAIAYIG